MSTALRTMIIFLCVQLFSIAEAKNAIRITAATGVFGKAIAERLAFEGNDLLITGRNSQKLDAMKKMLQEKYPKLQLQSIIIDFSDFKTIEHAARKLLDYPLNGIVLIGPRPALPKDVIPNKNEWTKVFAEIFIAPIEVVRFFKDNLQDI